MGAPEQSYAAAPVQFAAAVAAPIVAPVAGDEWHVVVLVGFGAVIAVGLISSIFFTGDAMLALLNTAATQLTTILSATAVVAMVTTAMVLVQKPVLLIPTLDTTPCTKLNTASVSPDLELPPCPPPTPCSSAVGLCHHARMSCSYTRISKSMAALAVLTQDSVNMSIL